MAQFDVYRVRGGGLVVDCQSDLLDAMPTRVVAPLRLTDGNSIKRLNPVFHVDRTDVAMVTQLIGAIAVRDIEATVGSLSNHEYEIKTALDMVVSGF